MTYSLDFRKKVLAVKKRESLSFEGVAQRFDIGSKNTVFRWTKPLEPFIADRLPRARGVRAARPEHRHHERDPRDRAPGVQVIGDVVEVVELVDVEVLVVLVVVVLVVLVVVWLQHDAFSIPVVAFPLSDSDTCPDESSPAANPMYPLHSPGMVFHSNL